jgi:hypothetical protein
VEQSEDRLMNHKGKGETIKYMERGNGSQV